MSQGAKDIDNLCSDISISTRLKNWRVMEGKKKYVESGKWDEYDENGALKRIPALLDVVLDIDLKSYYMKHSSIMGDVVIDDFTVSIDVSLKMGESTDCINILNPKIVNSGTLMSKKVTYSDFFPAKKYRSVQIITPFQIKQALEKIESDELMLSQIIVIVTIKSLKTGKECTIEYSKPIC